jgi:hypothetical protein
MTTARTDPKPIVAKHKYPKTRTKALEVTIRKSIFSPQEETPGVRFELTTNGLTVPFPV